jgi:hypothetical protein
MQAIEYFDELREYAEPEKALEVPEPLPALHKSQIPYDAVRAVAQLSQRAAAEVAPDSHAPRLQGLYGASILDSALINRPLMLVGR